MPEEQLAFGSLLARLIPLKLHYEPLVPAVHEAFTAAVSTPLTLPDGRWFDFSKHHALVQLLWRHIPLSV